MPGHDLIVIGGSAGSIDPLQAVLATLPADLPAAICVVVHTLPYLKSNLADVLKRSTNLPVLPATDSASLQHGVAFVAVPDQHLLIEPSRVRLSRGPRENRTRPAIDPLFRSAALYYGPRVIGVILSGALDDGTPGLWTVKDRGGIAVIQDPSEAVVQSMPVRALSNVQVDHIVPSVEIGPLLVDLVGAPADAREVHPCGDTDDLQSEVAIAGLDEHAHGRGAAMSSPGAR